VAAAACPPSEGRDRQYPSAERQGDPGVASATPGKCGISIRFRHGAWWSCNDGGISEDDRKDWRSRKAIVPDPPHMLRHSTGYKLANDGQDTRSLQHYMGHKNIMHTARYTEMAPDRFKNFWKD
jgi:hypothetical protein